MNFLKNFKAKIAAKFKGKELSEEWSRPFNYKKNVDLYAIYFPQFHEIEENNVTFYKGFHDMKNLEELYKINPSVSIPARGFYSLDDSKVVFEQIEEAKNYGLKGFATYWYWFGTNTITNKHKVMDKVNDMFFERDVDNFDIFFIWANEDWSGNPAFNSGDKDHRHKIENAYTDEEMELHFKDLMEYFKHKNYKKINNKPVFGIHHSHEIVGKGRSIESFVQMLDKACVDAGFEGVEILIKKDYENNVPNTVSYNFFPKVNSFGENEYGIDYEKQIEAALSPGNEKDIFVLFNEHDMTARLLYHKNKIERKTRNLSIENYEKLARIQLSYYRKERAGLSRIYLLNAWNEWGENMAFEPSKQKGDLYLRVLSKIIVGK